MTVHVRGNAWMYSRVERWPIVRLHRRTNSRRTKATNDGRNVLRGRFTPADALLVAVWSWWLEEKQRGEKGCRVSTFSFTSLFGYFRRMIWIKSSSRRLRGMPASVCCCWRYVWIASVKSDLFEHRPCQLSSHLPRDSFPSLAYIEYSGWVLLKYVSSLSNVDGSILVVLFLGEVLNKGSRRADHFEQQFCSMKSSKRSFIRLYFGEKELPGALSFTCFRWWLAFPRCQELIDLLPA